MIKIKERVSKMQKAVWTMKDNVYHSTKNMNCDKFFEYISEKSRNLLMDEKNRLPVKPKSFVRLKAKI